MDPPRNSTSENSGQNVLPSIAVVTPSYNTAQYLRPAIQSVIDQDYAAPVDFIVMDGGSTDHSTEVLKSFGDALRWVSQRDRGQSDAINRGLAHTTGDVLGWLNSDDTYAHGAFRAVGEYFAAHPDVDCIYGDANFIDADGNLIAPCAHIEPFDRHRLLHYSDIIVQPAAFFRRAAFEAVGGVDLSINWAMDWDLWLKLSAAGKKFAYVPKLLANFRWLGDAKTAAGGWGRIDEIAKMVRKYGANRLPAYVRLEVVNLHLQEARGAWKLGDTPAAVRSFTRALWSLATSPRAMISALRPQVWRIVYTGQVLRARALKQQRADTETVKGVGG